MQANGARATASAPVLLLTVLAVACGGDHEAERCVTPDAPQEGLPVGQPASDLDVVETFGLGSYGPRIVLGAGLGRYVTIEGVRAEKGKVGSRTLVVDTVGGKKLASPVDIWVHNLDLPANERCVFKGYESGHMIGVPPAVYEAAKEQGREANTPQAGWQWRPYFVVLIVVEPKGLEVPAER